MDLNWFDYILLAWPLWLGVLLVLVCCLQDSRDYRESVALGTYRLGGTEPTGLSSRGTGEYAREELMGMAKAARKCLVDHGGQQIRCTVHGPTDYIIFSYRFGDAYLEIGLLADEVKAAGDGLSDLVRQRTDQQLKVSSWRMRKMGTSDSKGQSNI